MTKLLKNNPAAKSAGLEGRPFAALRERGYGPPFYLIAGVPYYDPDEVDAWKRSCRRVPGQATETQPDDGEPSRSAA